MKILVCGGRDYSNADRVWEVLDPFREAYELTHVVQGGANGADALAKAWAVERGVAVVEVPANWDFHGRKAGPIRNAAMLGLLAPGHDLVIAFPGGRGTESMVRLAEAAGVRVIRVG